MTNATLSLKTASSHDDMPQITEVILTIDGVERFLVTLLCDDGIDTASVKDLTDMSTAELPYIYSSYQLIGLVDDVLQREMQREGHEFYDDVFFETDEDGNSTPISISVSHMFVDPKLYV